MDNENEDMSQSLIPEIPERIEALASAPPMPENPPETSDQDEASIPSDPSMAVNQTLLDTFKKVQTDSALGKTAFVRVITQNIFTEQTLPTIAQLNALLHEKSFISVIINCSSDTFNAVLPYIVHYYTPTDPSQDSFINTLLSSKNANNIQAFLDSLPLEKNTSDVLLRYLEERLELKESSASTTQLLLQKIKEIAMTSRNPDDILSNANIPLWNINFNEDYAKTFIDLVNLINTENERCRLFKRYKKTSTVPFLYKTETILTPLTENTDVPPKHAEEMLLLIIKKLDWETQKLLARGSEKNVSAITIQGNPYDITLGVFRLLISMHKELGEMRDAHTSPYNCQRLAQIIEDAKQCFEDLENQEDISKKNDSHNALLALGWRWQNILHGFLSWNLGEETRTLIRTLSNNSPTRYYLNELASSLSTLPNFNFAQKTPYQVDIPIDEDFLHKMNDKIKSPPLRGTILHLLRSLNKHQNIVSVIENRVDNLQQGNPLLLATKESVEVFQGWVTILSTLDNNRFLLCFTKALIALSNNENNEKEQILLQSILTKGFDSTSQNEAIKYGESLAEAITMKVQNTLSVDALLDFAIRMPAEHQTALYNHLKSNAAFTSHSFSNPLTKIDVALLQLTDCKTVNGQPVCNSDEWKKLRDIRLAISDCPSDKRFILIGQWHASTITLMNMLKTKQPIITLMIETTAFLPEESLVNSLVIPIPQKTIEPPKINNPRIEEPPVTKRPSAEHQDGNAPQEIFNALKGAIKQNYYFSEYLFTSLAALDLFNDQYTISKKQLNILLTERPKNTSFLSNTLSSGILDHTTCNQIINYIDTENISADIFRSDILSFVNTLPFDAWTKIFLMIQRHPDKDKKDIFLLTTSLIKIIVSSTIFTMKNKLEAIATIVKTVVDNDDLHTRFLKANPDFSPKFFAQTQIATASLTYKVQRELILLQLNSMLYSETENSLLEEFIAQFSRACNENSQDPDITQQGLLICYKEHLKKNANIFKLLQQLSTLRAQQYAKSSILSADALKEPIEPKTLIAEPVITASTSTIELISHEISIINGTEEPRAPSTDSNVQTLFDISQLSLETQANLIKNNGLPYSTNNIEETIRKFIEHACEEFSAISIIKDCMSHNQGIRLSHWSSYNAEVNMLVNNPENDVLLSLEVKNNWLNQLVQISDPNFSERENIIMHMIKWLSYRDPAVQEALFEKHFTSKKPFFLATLLQNNSENLLFFDIMLTLKNNPQLRIHLFTQTAISLKDHLKTPPIANAFLLSLQALTVDEHADLIKALRATKSDAIEKLYKVCDSLRDKIRLNMMLFAYYIKEGILQPSDAYGTLYSAILDGVEQDNMNQLIQAITCLDTFLSRRQRKEYTFFELSPKSPIASSPDNHDLLETLRNLLVMKHTLPKAELVQVHYTSEEDGDNKKNDASGSSNESKPII